MSTAGRALVGGTLGIALGLLPARGLPLAEAAPDLLVGAAWAATAAVVVPRARSSAGLAAAVAVTWFLADVEPAAALWHRAVLVHLLLAMPGLLPRTRTGRVIVLAAYASAFTSAPWVSIALAAAVVAALAVERSGTHGRRRHVRTVALRTGVALAVMWALAALVLAVSVLPRSGLAVLLTYDAVLVAAAVAVAGALLPARAQRATDLVVELGEVRSGVLEDALRNALRDPDLVVGFWERDGYVDADGRVVAGGAPPPGRARTTVVAAGRPVALVEHDVALLDEPALLTAIDSATRLTSSNVALQSAARAHVRAVERSRARLVTTSARERATVRAEIESGSGARIAAVLDALPAHGDPHLAAAAEHLRRTLEDLNALTRGLSPRASAGTLPELLDELAGVGPTPVVVDAPDVRLADAPRSAVYLTCAEALANVAKHARAHVVHLVARVDGEILSLEVRDDGVGGARVRGGGGLAGVADRLEALGGSVVVTSPPGEGTRLVLTVPLGSGTP